MIRKGNNYEDPWLSPQSNDWCRARCQFNNGGECIANVPIVRVCIREPPPGAGATALARLCRRPRSRDEPGIAFPPLGSDEALLALLALLDVGPLLGKFSLGLRAPSRDPGQGLSVICPWSYGNHIVKYSAV
jgi:hypothetical protein